MANAIVTVTARKKMLQARAGEITLPKITGFAFGNGGVDEDGTVRPPGEGQLELTSEIFRKPVSGYTMLSDTQCRYECTLENHELPGEKISEIGMYDEEGDIVAIKTFTEKGKDSDIEMTFHLEDSF